MSKYIDAEAFKRRILSYGTVHEGDRIQIPFYKHYFAKAYVAILRWVCEEVDDTPTADVEEVVRCRECKYYIEREDGYICANDYLYKDSEWFCADGEKNE